MVGVCIFFTYVSLLALEALAYISLPSSTAVVSRTAKEALVARGFKPSVLALGPPFLGTLPFQHTYLCDEGYGPITYQADRFGFRNPDATWENSSPDVLLVGDSFVQGQCVPDGYTPGGILCERFAVTTLGVGGASSVHYRALLETYCSLLSPKNLVVLFYAGNDHSASAWDVDWSRELQEGVGTWVPAGCTTDKPHICGNSQAVNGLPPYFEAALNSHCYSKRKAEGQQP